ncbi:MAG TPA: hypothetical protein VL595_06595 [Pseudonocardia sp.]|nr:hypothetical protein [Pseudonocardia sp.]
MRQLLAGLVGLLLTAAFALAAGRGVGLTFRPTTTGVPMDRAPGLAWLLAAGVFLGLLVLSRRYSPTVPLVAGVLLLVATLVGMASPQFLAPTSTGGAAFGMYVLNGYGLGVLFAALLLVVAVMPVGKARETAS